MPELLQAEEDQPTPFGTHPDILPILATLLLQRNHKRTLVNLASTCRENWLNLGGLVEKGKMVYRRAKKSWTLLEDYTPAQFKLVREAWIPTEWYAFATSTVEQRVEEMFVPNPDKPAYPRIPALLHIAPNLERLCVSESVNVAPYLLEALGHYELPKSLRTLQISHAPTNPGSSIIPSQDPFYRYLPPAGNIDALNIELIYTRTHGHSLFDTVIAQLDDAIDLLMPCWDGLAHLPLRTWRISLRNHHAVHDESSKLPRVVQLEVIDKFEKRFMLVADEIPRGDDTNLELVDFLRQMSWQVEKKWQGIASVTVTMIMTLPASEASEDKQPSLTPHLEAWRNLACGVLDNLQNCQFLGDVNIRVRVLAFERKNQKRPLPMRDEATVELRGTSQSVVLGDTEELM